MWIQKRRDRKRERENRVSLAVYRNWSISRGWVDNIYRLTTLGQSRRHLVLSGVDITSRPATLGTQGDQGLDQNLTHRTHTKA